MTEQAQEIGEARPRTRKLRRTLGYFLVLGILFVTVSFWFVFRPSTPGGNIPKGWGFQEMETYRGQPYTPHPLRAFEVPQHPKLAPTNSATMHVDAYSSGVHPAGGPLGIQPIVKSYSHGALGGECATVTFDSRGRILAVCATFLNFSVVLLSPDSLTPLDSLKLPPRASNRSLNLRKIMSDTSGGAYFFLDDQDRVVLVDSRQRLRVIKSTDKDGSPRLLEVASTDLSGHLIGSGDVVTAVLPDWQGRYWFVSRQGVVGVISSDFGRASTYTLANEQIQNALSIDSDSVFVLSDRALYSFAAGTDLDADAPTLRWRQEYRRSTKPKSGSLTLGSGTTPTLLGDRYVAIADNGDPQISVLILRRRSRPGANREVCSIAVFPAGRSATENSLVGFGNSIIVENNYGYDLFPTMMFGKTSEGGVARIDFDERNEACHLRWESPLISQTTVPKVSAETGLLYLYTKEPEAPWGVDAYYLSAVDLESGETVFQILAGTGVSYDNNWAPITLGPDNCAYVGVLRGLVQICDGGDRDGR